ncbi:hypothetical protein KAI87_17485, partial [Myxococcota bacterium]|nr:hypothetical protein [Myxococcota bacterium]
VGRGVGASEELARISAVKKSGPKVIQELIDSLIQAWKSEANNGKRFRIIVMKVRKYRSHARPFMKALEGLPNVQNVKEVSYGGKRLELEVIYKGSKRDLVNAIYDDIGTIKKFRKIDKVVDRGNTIEFKL